MVIFFISLVPFVECVTGILIMNTPANTDLHDFHKLYVNLDLFSLRIQHKLTFATLCCFHPSLLIVRDKDTPDISIFFYFLVVGLMFQKVCSWPQLQALSLLFRISTNFLTVHQTTENVKVCFLLYEFILVITSDQ